MNRHRFAALLLSTTFGLLALQSCFAEPPLQGPSTGGPSGGPGGAPAFTTAGEAGMVAAPAQCVPREAMDGAECRPVVTSEPLHARLVSDQPVDTTMFSLDLFSQFKAHCGACHVDNSLGQKPFNVTASNFATTLTQDSLDRIRSNDPLKVMPPISSKGKLWQDREPTEAMSLFAAYLDIWLKAGSPADIFVVPAAENPIQSAPYAIDEEFSRTLTSLGTCIPDAGMVGTSGSQEGDRACSLDEFFAQLEKDPMGTPEQRLGLPLNLYSTDLFTLDSDELARNGVVAFQPAYPLWTDDAGKLRHVRVPYGQSIKYDAATKRFEIPPNTRFYKTFLKKVKEADGEERYQKIETRIIVSRPNGESLFGTYEWHPTEAYATLLTEPERNNEPWVDKLITLVVDWQKYAEVAAKNPRNLRYALDDAHALRRYAIPGRERCIQCHMGSDNDSFILGFTPLQLNRRPAGEGGVLDGHGIDTDDDGKPDAFGPTADELSQLQRLIDYGIVTGLDAAEAPVLEQPQGTRAFRNEHELKAQGYLLGNCAHCHNPVGYPTVQNPELGALLDFLPSETGGIFQFPLERYSPRIARGPQGERRLAYITPSLYDLPVPDILPQRDAPWRSLIYRNVDAPFTYSYDSAIFPHMPLNTSGFDCRVPSLLGNWMVSIPTKKKHPTLREEVASVNELGAETDPQPHVEVLPDEPGYLNAKAEAQKRLAKYQEGPRYTYCPDTSDIVDRDVLEGRWVTPRDGVVSTLPVEGIPDRPHFVVTDLSEVPGEWFPRRGDWQTVFKDGLPPFSVNPGDTDYKLKRAAYQGEAEVLAHLESVTLDSISEFATTPLPFGTWKQKDACDFSATKKVQDYTGKRPRWMASAPPSAPVYETLPGHAIYNMICVNCHGADADSRGRQATTLQDLTGGTGRVANFRDGLFGPFGTQDNRDRVFDDEDLPARYLAWMALGGTKIQIPQPILQLVANTTVLGASRSGSTALNNLSLSANMLQTAQALCREALPASQVGFAFDGDDLAYSGWVGLIYSNGDAELWQRLCNLDNPPPVRGITFLPEASGGGKLTLNPAFMYFRDKYPANTPVGSHGKVDASLTDANSFPWCILTPTDAPTAEKAAAFAADNPRNGGPLPLCPPSFAVEENRMMADADGVRDDLRKWAGRGAINAGLAVYVYLDLLISKGYKPPPRFDECELLE